MIQINLLSDEQKAYAEQQALQQDKLAAAVGDFKSRPANLRNTESKKVKCGVCRARMTIAELRQHNHEYVGITTKFSSAAFKSRRKNPHHSKRNLQLVERVKSKLSHIQASDELNADDLQFLINEAKTAANRELKAERLADAKIHRDIQKKSRAINRG